MSAASGGSNAQIPGGPPGVASAVTGLASLILLTIALVGLLDRVDRLRTGTRLADRHDRHHHDRRRPMGTRVPAPRPVRHAPVIADSGLSTVTAGYQYRLAR